MGRTLPGGDDQQVSVTVVVDGHNQAKRWYRRTRSVQATTVPRSMLDATTSAPTLSIQGGETAARTLPLAIKVVAITLVGDGAAATTLPAPPLDGGGGQGCSRRRRRRSKARRRRRQSHPRDVPAGWGRRVRREGGQKRLPGTQRGQMRSAGGVETRLTGAGRGPRPARGMWWLS
eukprot:TRINITY_DN577_c0_g1_i4.p2 TRINITY_DN577_c0_g1~~TRINITY_DN577_c0_g1_i4.p2  ORF type:complete len:175 (+),score=12.75 TRINITY_DN577_c0_g1_i4:995-1519(+)